MSVGPIVGESGAVLVALDNGLARLHRGEIPYKHAATVDIFDEELVSQLVQAFAYGVQWQHSEGLWHSFSYASPAAVDWLCGSPIAGLIGTQAQEIMRAHLGTTFAREFTSKVELCIHRLDEGQWIGTHNDSPAPSGRSHCLVFTFSPAKLPRRGGEFLLMRFDPTGRKRDELVVGGHNSAVAIEISDQSFHRVGRVCEGRCYFLVCSFWAGYAADETTGRDSNSVQPLAAVRRRSNGNSG